jgi:hypothetical protein
MRVVRAVMRLPTRLDANGLHHGVPAGGPGRDERVRLPTSSAIAPLECLVVLLEKSADLLGELVNSRNGKAARRPSQVALPAYRCSRGNNVTMWLICAAKDDDCGVIATIRPYFGQESFHCPARADFCAKLTPAACRERPCGPAVHGGHQSRPHYPATLGLIPCLVT